jgi:hypothetical protein
MPKWEGVETVLFYMDWVEGKLAGLHKWPDTTKLGTAGHRRQDICGLIGRIQTAFRPCEMTI